MVDKSRNITGLKIKPPSKRKKCISTQQSRVLGEILKIFFCDEKIIGLSKDPKEQEKIYYEAEFGRSEKAYFVPDYVIYFKNKKIVYEYDGPVHYNKVFKMERDARKKAVFENQGIKIHNVPYYLNSFTKDIAKYYFCPYKVYSEEKYKIMLSELFQVDHESELLAPGWHTTTDTPADFVYAGLDAIIDELKDFPDSLKCQLVHSLNLYKKAYDGKRDWLIHPSHHMEFNKLMLHKPKRENLNYYFALDFD